MINKPNLIRIAAVLAALLVFVGCAGIQPYNPPNHREEGPAKGLFTGSQGAWVIVGPPAAPTDGAAKKNGAPESDIDREKNKDTEESAGSE